MKTTAQKNAYQILKSNIIPLLLEDKDSFFYYLHQKRANQKANRKRALVNILNETGRAVSFFEIVAILISNDDMDTLLELILSERVSSSKKAILHGYDSCLLCKKDTVCNNILTSLKYPDRVNYLFYLRFIKAKKFMKMLKWGISTSCFKILLDEPILMKFLANYALVVDIKNELKKEGVIKKGHKTLYKGAGKYCPFDDLYELTDNSQEVTLQSC